MGQHLRAIITAERRTRGVQGYSKMRSQSTLASMVARSSQSKIIKGALITCKQTIKKSSANQGRSCIDCEKEWFKPVAEAVETPSPLVLDPPARDETISGSSETTLRQNPPVSFGVEGCREVMVPAPYQVSSSINRHASSSPRHRRRRPEGSSGH